MDTLQQRCWRDLSAPYVPSLPILNLGLSAAANYSQIADLAAHKNPNLSVLQIGGTEALIRELLSVLGAGAGSAGRFKSYTVAHPENEWINKAEETFEDVSGNLDFKLFEIDSANETFDSESYDLVVSGNEVSGTDYKHGVVSVAKKVLKAGGVALLSDAKDGSHGL